MGKRTTYTIHNNVYLLFMECKRRRKKNKPSVDSFKLRNNNEYNISIYIRKVFYFECVFLSVNKKIQ